MQVVGSVGLTDSHMGPVSQCLRKRLRSMLGRPHVTFVWPFRTGSTLLKVPCVVCATRMTELWSHEALRRCHNKEAVGLPVPGCP